MVFSFYLVAWCLIIRHDRYLKLFASLSGGVEKVHSAVEFESLPCVVGGWQQMSFLWTARRTIVLFEVCADVLVLGFGKSALSKAQS